jgi:hypothetical protein
LRPEPREARIALEESALDLALFVLEREVCVATRGHPAARDLSGYPDIPEFDLKHGPDGRIQLAHAEDAPFRRKRQFHLTGFAIKSTEHSILVSDIRTDDATLDSGTRWYSNGFPE